MSLQLNEPDAEPMEKAMILKEPPQEETYLKTERLLQELPLELFLGQILARASQLLTLMTLDTTLSLPNIHQYPLRPMRWLELNPSYKMTFKGAYNSMYEPL